MDVARWKDGICTRGGTASCLGNMRRIGAPAHIGFHFGCVQPQARASAKGRGCLLLHLASLQMTYFNLRSRWVVGLAQCLLGLADRAALDFDRQRHRGQRRQYFHHCHRKEALVASEVGPRAAVAAPRKQVDHHWQRLGSYWGGRSCAGSARTSGAGYWGCSGPRAAEVYCYRVEGGRRSSRQAPREHREAWEARTSLSRGLRAGRRGCGLRPSREMLRAGVWG